MSSESVPPSAAFHPLVVIPVFDHEHAIATMVAGVVATGMPCLLVDDGSGEACARELDRLAALHAPQVRLLRLPVNQGKGGAVLAGFRDAAAHAVPSPIGEDDVKITVVLIEGADVTEEALCRWVADRVPFFAIPRYVEFRADLPRNPVGRVLKYQLRDEGVTATTWDREAAGVEFDRR